MKPIDLIALILAGISLTLGGYVLGRTEVRAVNSHARLVGHGCVGANGPLYAAEEDHFPQCELIYVR